MSISSALNGGDFDVFLDAAQKINEGQNIYVGPFIKGLQYYYSPLFAMLLIPFTGNFFIIELVWLLISGFWMYRIWKLISKYFDSSVFTENEIMMWVGISFFLIIRFVLYNIAMIQVTIFLLWAILESIRFIDNNDDVKGAALLALVINIKLMPIVTIPYLLYQGHFKAVLFIIGFFVLYLIIPALFIGYDFNMFLLSEWWEIINPGKSEHLIEAEITYQSLVGTIPVFLTETESIIDLKRNFVNLPVELVATITNIMRLIVAGFTIFFLGKPLVNDGTKVSKIRAISYLLLAIPLIFPHQQKYAFLLMFPMISYLTYFAILKWKLARDSYSYGFMILSILVIWVFTPIIGSDIIGRYNYDVIQHFRFLGISAFLLIPLAVYASPTKIDRMISDTKTNVK